MQATIETFRRSLYNNLAESISDIKRNLIILDTVYSYSMGVMLYLQLTGLIYLIVTHKF